MIVRLTAQRTSTVNGCLDYTHPSPLTILFHADPLGPITDVMIFGSLDDGVCAPFSFDTTLVARPVAARYEDPVSVPMNLILFEITADDHGRRHRPPSEGP
jgi:hypothetical protein